MDSFVLVGGGDVLALEGNSRKVMFGRVGDWLGFDLATSTVVPGLSGIVVVHLILIF